MAYKIEETDPEVLRFVEVAEDEGLEALINNYKTDNKKSLEQNIYEKFGDNAQVWTSYWSN